MGSIVRCTMVNNLDMGLGKYKSSCLEHVPQLVRCKCTVSVLFGIDITDLKRSAGNGCVHRSLR